MATARAEPEGDDLIQHFEISSTSDSYYLPLRVSKSFPLCRSSYRRRFLRNNRSYITYPNPRIMQNPSVTVNNLSKSDRLIVIGM